MTRVKTRRDYTGSPDCLETHHREYHSVCVCSCDIMKVNYSNDKHSRSMGNPNTSLICLCTGKSLFFNDADLAGF